MTRVQLRQWAKKVLKGKSKGWGPVPKALAAFVLEHTTRVTRNEVGRTVTALDHHWGDGSFELGYRAGAKRLGKTR